MVAARTKDPLAAPKFWETSGTPSTLRVVQSFSVEGRALADHFLRLMPPDAALRTISRVENRQPWRQYKTYRNELYDEFEREQWDVDGLEMYLWHGTDAIDQTVNNGFNLAQTNMEFNMYGAGLYFAPDPRLSHFFCRSSRGQPSAVCRLILARVAVGWCATKEALPSHSPDCRKKDPTCRFWKCREMRAENLRKVEHRQPPETFHSCTSKNRTEVIVYKDVHAYPAYVFEYSCPTLANFDPYANIASLQWIDWRHRAHHSVDFNWYRHHACAKSAGDRSQLHGEVSRSSNSQDADAAEACTEAVSVNWLIQSDMVRWALEQLIIGHKRKEIFSGGTSYAMVGNVQFPKPKDININMMPFIMGDASSVPKAYLHYWPLISKCDLAGDGRQDGLVCYLTIQESWVSPGDSQRRSGIHTESPGIIMTEAGELLYTRWGAGEILEDNTWVKGARGVIAGFSGGIYMASTISNSCRLWNITVEELGEVTSAVHGLEDHRELFDTCKTRYPQAGELFWFTDKTPHESLPLVESCYRQFFRVVTSDVSVWYSKHSHANPLGIVPPDRVTVCTQDKFEVDSYLRPFLQQPKEPMFIDYDIDEDRMPQGDDELMLQDGEVIHVPYEVPHLVFASCGWAFGCSPRLLRQARDKAWGWFPVKCARLECVWRVGEKK